jgi:uncharacterized protein (DUF58 family)
MLTLTDRVRASDGERLVPVGPLPARGGIPSRFEYELPTDRRGMLNVGPLSVDRRDPLGLCRADRVVGAVASLLVLPRWHRLRGVPRGTSPSFEGVADAARHGSITFHSLREYQWGDDLRHVHWRTSARAGSLLVREYIDAAWPRLVLLVDNRAEAYPGDDDAAEDALEAAASILVAAGDAGLPVTLRLAGGPEVASTTGAGLELLALARVVDGVSLAATMRRLPADDPPGELVIVTGSKAELGPIVAARRGYARVVVVSFGSTQTALASPVGVTVLRAASVAEFVTCWAPLWM